MSDMTKSKLQGVRLIAALVIALVGAAAASNIAAAQTPAAAVMQAEDEEKGVLIVAVPRGSPAAKAGLRRGDIILKVNDVEVNDAQALRDALAGHKPGDTVQIRVARGDRELTVQVKLGEADGRPILGVTPLQDPSPWAEAMPAPPDQAPRPLPFDPEAWRKRLEEWLSRFSSEVRVTEVITNSPAAKAGLRRGDIIIAVNENRLDAQNPLADVIARFKPGDTVTLTLRRDDAEKTLKVTLGENPQKKGAAFLGIRYAPAFDAIGRFPPVLPRDRAPATETWAAVTINEVVVGSPADKAGLKRGDLILAANDKPITSPQDLVELVRASKPGDRITLSVQRRQEDKPVEITVTLGENPDKAGAAYMGVSLGQFLRVERLLPDGEENSPKGFEIIPGFRLPFNFDDLPLPPLLPPQAPDATGRDA
ncbi:MAG: hypothetical protein CUN48_07850 [Candidatus Thermofonsia Clade 3 bacterium]|jgi:S1-C subfamily serine protease|uniref:PDZ domain-containing protein n=2 Tax=Candidatus Thermofonsia Clade 3 TaxID=2364209 RepID=A0A2M8QCP6_9CHLR|nr:MAG: hypothetical protein CUN48_07850 [Candidatus Thermofonsia Clade 3 bacterium]